VRARAQQSKRQHDLIPEVDLVVADHQRLVLRIRRGQLGLRLRTIELLLVRGVGAQSGRAGEVVVRRDVLVLAAAEQRDQRLQIPGRITERPIARQREVEEAVAQENDLLGAAQHAEVVLQPDLQRVPAQQRVAERVEGGDLDVSVAVRHQLVDPGLHLSRRLVGEREGKNLLGPGPALVDQVGDAPRDDGGFAGARPRHDEQRPGVVGDGLTLGAVEAIEDPTRHAPRL